MIMNEGFFALDTNILIYLESADARKRQIAETLLSCDPVISAQVISEFINVTRRLRNITKNQLIAEAVALFRHCPIAPTQHSTLEMAADLIHHYDFQIFDAIVVASALESQCSFLYSEDMYHQLHVNNSLVIINPFK
ncbi:twitching motility protein PilT [Bacteroidia bacterium]|nr:twitching motility protein PilT [Bacteroidia bacterium]